MGSRNQPARPGQAQGKVNRSFNKGGFTFNTDQGWESLFLVSPEAQAVVAAKTAELAEKIIKAAPLGPHRFTDEYSIKKNIEAKIEKVDGEWVGFVVIEEDEHARHAMLQELGYRDPSGLRHRGRFFIKAVLERERIE